MIGGLYPGSTYFGGSSAVRRLTRAIAKSVKRIVGAFGSSKAVTIGRSAKIVRIRKDL